MQAISMTIEDVEDHPHAHSLKVYKVGAFNRPSIVVVANLDNIYDVGQTVIVALVGSVLKDYTKISKARLRGVDSFGMLLGAYDGEAGVDLSLEYCLVDAVGSKDAALVNWGSIEGMHNVRLGLKIRADMGEGFKPPTVNYRAKVKLHGTNSGVQIRQDGSVVAQGRNRLLSEKEDSFGFARWVKAYQYKFAQMRCDDNLVVFGEWCGRGIQQKVAITKIEKKVFCVFAIQRHTGRENTERLITHPADIRSMLPEIDGMYVIPWVSGSIRLDWKDKEQLEGGAALINKLVDEVEKLDPFVKDNFGIQGMGEGVVMYPVSDEESFDKEQVMELMFKAKGEEHKIVEKKVPASLDPEVAASVDEFVKMFVTEARLEQGVQEACDGVVDAKKTGLFLKWFGGDVKKESVAELEASGLDWKLVRKAVTTAARNWFMEKQADV